ncbi:DNA polymerase IV [Rhabdobacter roseus]|uniref:DNA polymerase IV n=1 Tax=Rhabdobacter roseus TaxID=1655419 RepID=A0A840TY93_9BACT|nr:DNA polymerase IV [Rhabdobacter roseus]MBB5286582.1 DNA polymerase-4 [Rhabdobacter roseus]
MEANRKIIHVDMDAFFASVEQRDFPELRGKPVAVGGSGDRGVVAAASYEARRYGVRSAMASKVARRKCPSLIFVKHRFDVYKQVSSQIRAIFAEYTPLVEPLSLDEAYLDVTENLRGLKSATLMAQEIKERIWQTTRLTASAGVSYNKFLAKLASDHRKPNGLFVIKPHEGLDFVAALPVERFHGVGRVTAEKMHRLGIQTGLDLRQQTEAFLRQHFGKSGGHYYRIARAEDQRPVEPDRIRKSVGSENTFGQDLDTLAEMQGGLAPLMDDVWRWCDRTQVFGRTVTVKIKLNDFQILTRSRSALLPIRERAFFEKVAYELLEENFPLPRPVRLLGVSLSNLEDTHPYEGKQLTLSF